MLSLTFALAVICATSINDESARVLLVLAIALFVILHPIQTLAALLTALGLFVYVKSRRK